MKCSMVDLKRSIGSDARQPSMILVFRTWKHGLGSQFLDLGIENPYARGVLAKMNYMRTRRVPCLELKSCKTVASSRIFMVYV